MMTQQINRCLSRHLPASKVAFKGVRSANNFPTSINNTPMCFVTNTHCEHYSGEHWVSIYVDKHRRCHYFDPYGLPPPHKQWQQWIKRHCRGFTTFRKQIQPLNTKTCGHFSIYYLYHRVHAPDSMSDHMLMHNISNKQVVMFVNKLLKT